MRIIDAIKQAGHGLPKSLAGLYTFMQAAPNLINETEQVTTGAASLDANMSVYQTEVTTGGTGAAEDLALADGAVVGQRKLVTAVDVTAGDSVNLTASAFANDTGAIITSVVLDATDEFHLMEWNGSAWRTIYTTATEA